jgi:hypothetical protein
MKLLLISFALAASICSTPWQLRGQATVDVSATVQFSSGQTLTVIDFSDYIGVQPGDVINVTVHFSSDKAGHALSIEALDGSQIIRASNGARVASDGTFRFSFQATTNAGRNEISLRDGPHVLTLQFWVLDLQNPQNNPPVITPGNPES